MTYSLVQLADRGADWKCPHCDLKVPAFSVGSECPRCGGVVDRHPAPFKSCDLPGSARAAAIRAMVGPNETVASMASAASAALASSLDVPLWQVEDAALNMAILASKAK